jgi:hypothetical protein
VFRSIVTCLALIPTPSSGEQWLQRCYSTAWADVLAGPGLPEYNHFPATNSLSEFVDSLAFRRQHRAATRTGVFNHAREQIGAEGHA